MEDDALNDVAELAAPDQINLSALLELISNERMKKNDSLERIKLAYDQDPRMKISPEQAHGRAMFNNEKNYDMGYSLEAGEKARNDQAEYLRKSMIDRDKDTFSGSDSDALIKLYSTVQKNMAKGNKGNWKPEVRGIGDALVAYDPNTHTVEELYRNERNSPLYASLFKHFSEKSLDSKMQFPDEASRMAYVAMQTEEAYKRSKSRDKVRVGSQPLATNQSPVADKPLTTTPGNVSKVKFDFTPDQLAKFNDPNYVKSVLSKMDPKDAPAFETWLKSANLPKLMTPGEVKFNETRGVNSANLAEALAKSIVSNENKPQHFNNLEMMLVSGKLPSGPLSQYKKTIGDLASVYDPKSELAERWSNNAAAYFGDLMNLVREDIKALGAGTSISNLDLITTQLSLGDLGNSLQGNLNLIALQRYMAMERAAYDKKYLKYINEHGGDGTGFITDKKLPPEYALSKKVHPNGLTQYVPITRSQYEQKFFNKYGKKPTEEQWLDYHGKSIKMMSSGK